MFAHRWRARRVLRSASCWCAAAATSARRSYFPRAALAEPEEALASLRHAVLRDAGSAAGGSAEAQAGGCRSLAQALSTRANRIRCSAHVLCGASGVRWVELTQENATQALRMRLRRSRAWTRCSPRSPTELDLPETAAADRVLRHQPHGRRGHRGLLRGVRPRRAAEEGVPALQHHGSHARR